MGGSTAAAAVGGSLSGGYTASKEWPSLRCFATVARKDKIPSSTFSPFLKTKQTIFQSVGAISHNRSFPNVSLQMPSTGLWESKKRSRAVVVSGKMFVDEMRSVAMKLHTKDQSSEGESQGSSSNKPIGKLQPSVEGYLRFLVDSKVVYDTLESIVQKSANPSYAKFKNTGLERSEKLGKDLEWFKEQGHTIPEPSSPGTNYARYLEQLSESDPQAFNLPFGAGYWLNIHSFYYYLGIQVLAGVMQSTGWPSVVALIGNWFGKSQRGLIMGIWNAHTSVGNITGSLIASALLAYGWGWSFVVPGLLIIIVGLVVFLFLPVNPEAMGEAADDYPGLDKLTLPLLTNRIIPKTKDKPVGFIEAWRIPGVAPFAFCLFFSKLVAYTFLYWLPFYISHTEIGGKYLSDSSAGTLSTLFDIGGVLGGILAGYFSDRLGARAIIAASFMYCAIPALFLYRTFGSISIYWNAGLMFITGMLVNGPYALITTAVSADLGTHSSLNGNSRALATVTAIIDGTGSVGAAVGPLLTGYISTNSWNEVFTMLMVSAFISGLLLTKLLIAEISSKIQESRSNLDNAVPRSFMASEVV